MGGGGKQCTLNTIHNEVIILFRLRLCQRTVDMCNSDSHNECMQRAATLPLTMHSLWPSDYSCLSRTYCIPTSL